MATKKAATQKTVTIKIDPKKIAQVEKQLQKISAEFNAGNVSLTNNSDLCALYAKWGPVLKFAAGLLFFKKNWQKGFRIFIQAIETNCDMNPEG